MCMIVRAIFLVGPGFEPLALQHNLSVGTGFEPLPLQHDLFVGPGFNSLTLIACFRSILSLADVSEMEENEGLLTIPPDYWLKGGKTSCLLACMVHWTNKEIGSNVAVLPPGQIRELQCNNPVARIVAEHDTAQKAPKRESKDKTHKRTTNQIEHMSVVKVQNDIVSTQLCLYDENRDAFVAAMGEAEYNNKIIKLLKKLSEPQGSMDNVDRECNENRKDNEKRDTEEEQYQLKCFV